MSDRCLLDLILEPGGLSVVFVDNEGTTTLNLDGYTCNSASYVKVLLNNRDPD